MESLELTTQAKRIMAVLQKADENSYKGAHAQACEFLRVYAGPKSSFLENMRSVEGYVPRRGCPIGANIMQSYIDYVEAGLAQEITPERKAQLDIVSDFLEQANALLETKGVHPAGPVVLVGATLEEFLRTWVESAGLGIGNRKPGLESYTAVLRDSELITKQDAKDITSWGGLRNHAAHGEWAEVSDKQRVALMLEGVNLFMRKYGTT
ncbi:MAG: hypothetical protein ABL983_06185 [Nitrospira sp.]